MRAPLQGRVLQTMAAKGLVWKGIAVRRNPARFYRAAIRVRRLVLALRLLVAGRWDLRVNAVQRQVGISSNAVPICRPYHHGFQREHAKPTRSAEKKD